MVAHVIKNDGGTVDPFSCVLETMSSVFTFDTKIANLVANEMQNDGSTVDQLSNLLESTLQSDNVSCVLTLATQPPSSPSAIEKWPSLSSVAITPTSSVHVAGKLNDADIIAKK